MPTRPAGLLFLARLERRNALGTVLHAFPRILQRFPRAELVVVGDGPERSSSKAGPKSLGRGSGSSGRSTGSVRSTMPVRTVPASHDARSFGVTLIESMAAPRRSSHRTSPVSEK